jgi:hypothetical protein
MKKVRKVSPSKMRYDKSHPLISFRASIKEKEKIQQMVESTGKSVSQLVKELLLNGYIDFETAINDALDVAKTEWAIGIPCNKCQGIILMTPKGIEHKHILNLFKSYKYGHPECYDEK